MTQVKLLQLGGIPLAALFKVHPEGQLLGLVALHRQNSQLGKRGGVGLTQVVKALLVLDEVGKRCHLGNGGRQGVEMRPGEVQLLKASSIRSGKCCI